MRKVAIIGTNGLPAKYGGFETLAKHLAENLKTKDTEIIVYCSKKKPQPKTYNGAKLIYFPFKANGWQSIIYDFTTIIHAFFSATDLIILGFSGAFAFPINKIFNKNIIFNIGGVEWKKVRGSNLTSKIEIAVKKYMEKLCVMNSNTVIIDNQHFFKYIKERYLKEPKISEYGGDHVQKIKISKELLKKHPFLATDYAVSVSRAQADMNIHLLINAYKKNTDKYIVIISNWQTSEYGRDLYKKNKYPNIILLDPIYNSTELDTIRSNSSLYIHTHSLCGTAPSLVEAMSLKLAVISYDVPTNRSTTENKAIYFKDENTLIKILKSLRNDKIKEVGNEMYKISKKRYSWKRICMVYNESLG